MLFRIPSEHIFPDPNLAEPNGLLAFGGDLHPERVLLAYRMGIFPWYSEGQPVLWWAPDPRMVLFPMELHVGRSLRKRLRQAPYRLTADTAFDEVVARCATVPRPGQDGTWITQAVTESFRALHRQGHAHSFEAWDGERLVGGLYGLAIGRVFCGESMFADAADASKIAFAASVRQLQRWGCPLIDCQVHTEHLERFGAREIERRAFLAELRKGREGTLPMGRWLLDPDLVSGDAWRT